MKLKKLLSCVAAVVTAGVMAVSASANWEVVKDGAAGLSSGTDNWMVPIFSNGDDPDVPKTDYGIDMATVKSVSFTFSIPEAEREFFNGDFGGGIVTSAHTTNIEKPEKATDDLKTMTDADGKKVTPYDYYNWYQPQYWGVKDPGAKNPDAYDIDGNPIEGVDPTINHLAEDKPYKTVTVAPYTYVLKGDLVNPIADGACKTEELTSFRVGIKTWSGDLFKATIDRCVVFDTSGKALIAFDGKGNKVDVTDDDEKAPVQMEAEGSSTPADSAAASTTDSAAASTADSAAASTADSAAASTTNSTAPAASTAASAASTASSSSGLPTGAIVGIAAGVVAIIIIIIVVVKKKKG